MELTAVDVPLQVLRLSAAVVRADLDDFILHSGIKVGGFFGQRIQDIEAEVPLAGALLGDDELFAAEQLPHLLQLPGDQATEEAVDAGGSKEIPLLADPGTR